MSHALQTPFNCYKPSREAAFLQIRRSRAKAAFRIRKYVCHRIRLGFTGNGTQIPPCFCPRPSRVFIAFVSNLSSSDIVSTRYRPFRQMRQWRGYKIAHRRSHEGHRNQSRLPPKWQGVVVTRTNTPETSTDAAVDSPNSRM